MLRKVVPRKIQTLIRFYTIFNKHYGHSRFQNGFCVDGAGDYVPWITYPCIEFINNLDFTNCRLFEYGSGSSTLYWAKRVKSVVSVERDLDWYKKVVASLPPNCELKHCGDETLYASAIREYDGNFDIVVIDGAIRYPCVEEALGKLSQDGIIILDNTEWYPNTAKLLRQRGYLQIDFCGFPPINAFTSCTSIFYKTSTFLSRRRDAPGWRPVGGKYLIAHDDKPFGEIDANLLVRS